MASKKTEQSNNPILFLQDSWAELKKVHPPSKDETIQATLVVFVLLLMFAVFLGLADMIVGTAMERILT